MKSLFFGLLSTLMFFFPLNAAYAQIKAVIFDCDGTLVDSEPAHFEAWEFAVRESEGVLARTEYPSFVGHPKDTTAVKLAAKIPGASAEVILRDKVAYYKKLTETGLPLIEPTVAFLKMLIQEKERLGLKIGICSAATREHVNTYINQLGISEHLDLVLSGQRDLGEYYDPEGVNKPKPYIYLHAQKLLGVAPEEMVVIEDSAAGVEAAVRAGCFTIAIPNEFTLFQDLSLANLQLPSLEGIGIEPFFKLVDREREEPNSSLRPL